MGGLLKAIFCVGLIAAAFLGGRMFLPIMTVYGSL